MSIRLGDTAPEGLLSLAPVLRKAHLRSCSSSSSQVEIIILWKSKRRDDIFRWALSKLRLDKAENCGGVRRNASRANLGCVITVRLPVGPIQVEQSCPLTSSGRTKILRPTSSWNKSVDAP